MVLLEVPEPLRNGFEGLILCVFSSFYVFVKYVKLREMEDRTGRAE